MESIKNEIMANIKGKSVLYNYSVVKRDDKDNGQVELAKVGGKKPKYATIEYVDAKIDTLEQRVNYRFDRLEELVAKIAEKVGV
ncbi:MAG: hypothetical protein LBF00_02300 [Mycoplasmataceae bacterium]|nr:hypothetical protein [Mycoplasmataceae bacterium]